MRPIAILGLLGVVIAGLGASDFAAAQAAYPSKPIQLVSPFAPGGTSDIVARAIAQELTTALGQPVYVDNRSGAGGNVGAELVARANPDGYTVLLSNSSLLAISPLLYSKLNYDAQADLAPVIVLASGANVLTVNPALKVKSVKELIALAKSQPGKLNFGSTGSGTTTHLAGEMFKQMAGVDIQHVPYRGAALATSALLGGDIQLMFDNVPSSVQLVKSGRLRALAVTGTQREEVFPDVPTVIESGLPKFEVGGWFSLSVPRKTPKEVIARLNAAAAQGLRSANFQKHMLDVGYRPAGGTPEQMAEMTRIEVERWTPIIKASGAKLD